MLLPRVREETQEVKLRIKTVLELHNPSHLTHALCQEIIAGTGGPLPDNFWDPAGITNGKTEKDGNGNSACPAEPLRALELVQGSSSQIFPSPPPPAPHP